ncbi:MerR family transcriptional regulator [Acinetobacter qingfengensis]|uniref:HTH merR-type domain-containing protein n=1 Tax=Acinetobacter qingfengensis TaxID=1262585 RepID=A0A1E7RCN5_9GAMM|nr:MerR family transcriptional regulator [Acinetobacter qingfengensis]KAA8734966.1 MerR family transcriptional regulator [Acinetobacter qingfengensis]OEY97053.1 hypothetical protein BJI46_11005 [Acinetobacter qingfengensis]
MYLISDLAKKANTTTDAIRFYLQKGLLKPTLKAENGYYFYDDVVLERLLFIRNCRDLDISIAEIEQLIFLLQDKARCCHTVNDLITQHITALDQKIMQLQKFREKLLDIRSSCTTVGTIESCSIIKHFEQGK